MVITKPAGMVVHPAMVIIQTLVNAIAHHLNIINIKKLEDPRLGLVHHIDKNTSGLLLVAKTPEAKTSFKAILSKNKKGST